MAEKEKEKEKGKGEELLEEYLRQREEAPVSTPTEHPPDRGGKIPKRKQAE